LSENNGTDVVQLSEKTIEHVLATCLHVLSTCLPRVYYMFATYFPLVHHKVWTKYALLAGMVMLINLNGFDDMIGLRPKTYSLHLQKWNLHSTSAEAPLAYILSHSFIHSFIHASHFYSAPSSIRTTTQRRSRLQHGYCIGVSRRSAQATAGKGLAKGPHGAGVEPTTLRLKVIVSTNAPPRPTQSHAIDS